MVLAVVILVAGLLMQSEGANDRRANDAPIVSTLAPP